MERIKPRLEDGGRMKMNPFQWMALGCMYAIVIWAHATYYGLTVYEYLFKFDGERR